jgi:guanosine-diphosphatase
MVKSIFPLEDVCPVPPCAFLGVPLPSSFHHMPLLYAFSYFYDRIEPHFPGMAQVSLDKVDALMHRLCSQPAEDLGPVPGSSASPSTNPNECLDMAFIRTLLLDAYGLPSTKRLSLVKKINGVETCWALGAAIDLFSQLESVQG